MTSVLIQVIDWYEGRYVLYYGNSYQEAKQAIRQCIEDTSAECDIAVKIVETDSEKAIIEELTHSPIKIALYDFMEDYTSFVLSSL